MKVYAFEWCDCTYESGFSVESLHSTRRGAYRAMRSRIVAGWISESRKQKYHNQRKDERYEWKPLSEVAWRVRVIEVMK